MLAGALIFIMVITARILSSKRQVDQEIAKLESQINKMQTDNEQLSDLVKYFNTPEYQEKQAREKLNLKKDGEYVVVLPSTNNAEETDDLTLDPSQNYQRWFNYFFHAN